MSRIAVTSETPMKDLEVLYEQDDSLKAVVDAIRPHMAAALQLKRDLEAKGIRADIYQDYDEKTQQFKITVSPNRVDVALQKKKKGKK